MTRDPRTRYPGHPRNGWSVNELARKTGASPRSIINWTSESRAAYLDRASTRGEKIRALRAEGLSMRAIAARLGCSVGTVHRHIHAEQARPASA